MTPMRAAFKEWAIVVDALGRGEQIIILRKGGIAEGRAGFQVEHPRFLLFPTLYHQQREQVLPAAQARYDLIAPTLPGPDALRLEYCAEVVAWRRLNSLATVERLRGSISGVTRCWRNGSTGETTGHLCLCRRVSRLAQRLDLPMLPAYGGCKSWIELAEEISTDDAQPVLSETAFQAGLRQFESALGSA